MSLLLSHLLARNAGRQQRSITAGYGLEDNPSHGRLHLHHGKEICLRSTMGDADSVSLRNRGVLTPVWFCGISAGKVQCTSLTKFHPLWLSLIPTDHTLGLTDMPRRPSRTETELLQDGREPGCGAADSALGAGATGLQLPPRRAGPGDRASPLQLFSFTLELFSPRQGGEGSGGRWAPSPDTPVRGCG